MVRFTAVMTTVAVAAAAAGVLWRGRHVGTLEPVLLKVLHAELADDCAGGVGDHGKAPTRGKAVGDGRLHAGAVDDHIPAAPPGQLAGGPGRGGAAEQPGVCRRLGLTSTMDTVAAPLRWAISIIIRPMVPAP
jgi:hypothetical protein